MKFKFLFAAYLVCFAVLLISEASVLEDNYYSRLMSCDITLKDDSKLELDCRDQDGSHLIEFNVSEPNYRFWSTLNASDISLSCKIQYRNRISRTQAYEKMTDLFASGQDVFIESHEYVRFYMRNQEIIPLCELLSNMQQIPSSRQSGLQVTIKENTSSSGNINIDLAQREFNQQRDYINSQRDLYYLRLALFSDENKYTWYVQALAKGKEHCDRGSLNGENLCALIQYQYGAHNIPEAEYFTRFWQAVEPNRLSSLGHPVDIETMIINSSYLYRFLPMEELSINSWQEGPLLIRRGRQLIDQLLNNETFRHNFFQIFKTSDPGVLANILNMLIFRAEHLDLFITTLATDPQNAISIVLHMFGHKVKYYSYEEGVLDYLRENFLQHSHSNILNRRFYEESFDIRLTQENSQETMSRILSNAEGSIIGVRVSNEVHQGIQNSYDFNTQDIQSMALKEQVVAFDRRVKERLNLTPDNAKEFFKNTRNVTRFYQEIIDFLKPKIAQSGTSEREPLRHIFGVFVPRQLSYADYLKYNVAVCHQTSLFAHYISAFYGRNTQLIIAESSEREGTSLISHAVIEDINTGIYIDTNWKKIALLKALYKNSVPLWENETKQKIFEPEL